MKIRSLTGFGNSSQFFLIEGETPEDVLRREEQLLDKLAKMTVPGTAHVLDSFLDISLRTIYGTAAAKPQVSGK